MSFRSKFLSKSNTKGGQNVEEEKQRPTQAVLAAGKRRGKKEKGFIPADDRRSLYLCFGEYEEGNKVSYTILSVSLRQLLAAPSPRKLQLFTKISGDGDDMPRYMGCGVWGSKILLGGGAKPMYMHCPIDGQPVFGRLRHHEVRKFYCFETGNGNGNGNGNDMMVEPPKKMLKGSIQPLLVEVDTKLYALGKSFRSFEMFDGDNWHELPKPPHGTFSCYPFTESHPDWKNDIYYAVAGTNILVSDGRSSFRFDTTDPDQSWRQLLHEPGFDFDRFSFKGTSLVVNDGKQFVLFTFQLSAGHHISVHLIPYDFSIIKQDYSRVQLPSYLMNYKDDHLGQLPLANYQLVHLGDNTVCLLLSELRHYANKKIIRCVEPVAFTFKVRDNATSSLKVKFLPRTPMLIYDEDNDDDVDVPSRAGQMLGAFMLENPQVLPAEFQSVEGG
ncbi:PREDICTED: uncharacterized protein LOC101302789 [Fragaria vesca subsp. vesca]|uniref:uncharacterized protein LOC101302789 n=1 Tax=Fragaria vesca subsp. vesca TaxID=101020 RepID=UPI0002C352A9|nr:PREDICTED: uncharacterized protein LOC101302789 [Fragaria vesca subsp. vesca]